MPFVRTLDPAQVIHDPAVMLAALAGMAVLGAVLVDGDLAARGAPHEDAP